MGLSISSPSAGGIPTSALDTDGTLAANSDAKVASQKATKTADATVLSSAQAYTDQQIQNFDLKDPVKAATTAALPFSPSYSNGSSGVGATLTGAVGVLAFDGYTPALNDRLLVKNQAAPAQNGIYKLTTVGTVVVGYVLTREPDFNQSTNILYGDSVGVLNGTANANQQFTMNNQSAITVGTTAITFAQTSGGSQLTAGDGIAITGNSIAVAAGTVKSILSIKVVSPSDTAGGFQVAEGAGVLYASVERGFSEFASNGLVETDMEFVMPYAATLRNLNVRSGDTVRTGIAPNTRITVRKNGTDTALVLTLAGTANTTTSDSTHSVSFAQGDLLTVSAVTAGAGTASAGIVSISVEVDAP